MSYYKFNFGKVKVNASANRFSKTSFSDYVNTEPRTNLVWESMPVKRRRSELITAIRILLISFSEA